MYLCVCFFFFFPLFFSFFLIIAISSSFFFSLSFFYFNTTFLYPSFHFFPFVLLRAITTCELYAIETTPAFSVILSRLFFVVVVAPPGFGTLTR